MEKIIPDPDNTGNKLIVDKKQDGFTYVYLKLDAENSRRLLGVGNESTKIFQIKRIRSKHLFKKNNSYGFNYYLLSNTKRFDSIELSDEIDSWKIPISFILNNGKFMNFKQLGFEKQIFVSLEDIKQYEFYRTI